LLKIIFLPKIHKKIIFSKKSVLGKKQYQYPNTVLVMLDASCPMITISWHPQSVLCSLYQGTNYFLLIFGKKIIFSKNKVLVNP